MRPTCRLGLLVLDGPLNHAGVPSTGSGNVRRRSVTGEPAGKLCQVTKDGGAPAAPNNPAGHFPAFLRDFEAVKNRAPQNLAMAGLVELMGGAQEAPEVYGAAATAGESRSGPDEGLLGRAWLPVVREVYDQVHGRRDASGVLVEQGVGNVVGGQDVPAPLS